MPQIVALDPATLPVSGAEIAVFVQDGVTVQAALSDIVSTLSGGVASAALTMPPEFTVTGSPVTSAGTLAVTLATQTAKKVWAGPANGAAAAPTFRYLTPADTTIQNGLVGHCANESIVVLGSSRGYQMDYVAALDKLFFTSNTSGGKLFYMDRTTDTAVLLATYAGKTPAAWCYSSVNGHLYIAYGLNTMEVDPSNGAIINAGISFPAAHGMTIRTSTGLIYGERLGDVKSLDPATNTVSATLLTLSGAIISDGPYPCVYCPDNDSVYFLGTSGNIIRFDIAAVTQTTITGFGGTISGGALIMGSDGLVYVVGINFQVLLTIDPSADVVADTYAWPVGYHGSGAGQGSQHAIQLGDYIYIGTQQTEPSIVLCFHKPTATFVTSLIGDATSGLSGRMLGGLASENVLYCGTGGSSLNATHYAVFGRQA